MKKKKDIEKELHRYDIPYEIIDGEFYLWHDYTEPVSLADVWDILNAHRYHKNPSSKRKAQKIQNTRIRQKRVDEEVNYKPDRWMWD